VNASRRPVPHVQTQVGAVDHPRRLENRYRQYGLVDPHISASRVRRISRRMRSSSPYSCGCERACSRQRCSKRMTCPRTELRRGTYVADRAEPSVDWNGIVFAAETQFRSDIVRTERVRSASARHRGIGRSRRARRRCRAIQVLVDQLDGPGTRGEIVQLAVGPGTRWSGH